MQKLLYVFLIINISICNLVYGQDTPFKTFDFLDARIETRPSNWPDKLTVKTESMTLGEFEKFIQSNLWVASYSCNGFPISKEQLLYANVVFDGITRDIATFEFTSQGELFRQTNSENNIRQYQLKTLKNNFFELTELDAMVSSQIAPAYILENGEKVFIMAITSIIGDLLCPSSNTIVIFTHQQLISYNSVLINLTFFT
jgi:hypothetical protein